MAESDAPTAAPGEGDPSSVTDTEATTAPNESPPADAANKNALDPSTHFSFQHKIFDVPGARFALTGPDRLPALRVNVGEHEASIPLDSLRQEFKINPDSQDGQMLDQVAQGLKFVKDIRPGDTIPRELLDGTASWSIEDHHGEVAKNRMMMDIAAWASGKGKGKARPPTRDLPAALQKPQTKALIEKGLDDLAVTLGMGKGRKDEVQDLINRIVRELAYIEALRDRYTHASEIREKLSQVATIHGSERHFVDEIQRVKILMGPPIKDFNQIFDTVDLQMRDVPYTLKTFSKQLIFIREMRDELHQKMLIWDEAIEYWDIDLSHKSKASREAVQFTYRFVAFNFPQSQDWF